MAPKNRVGIIVPSWQKREQTARVQTGGYAVCKSFVHPSVLSQFSLKAANGILKLAESEKENRLLLNSIGSYASFGSENLRKSTCDWQSATHSILYYRYFALFCSQQNWPILNRLCQDRTHADLNLRGQITTRIRQYADTASVCFFEFENSNLKLALSYF